MNKRRRYQNQRWRSYTRYLNEFFSLLKQETSLTEKGKRRFRLVMKLSGITRWPDY